MRPRTAVVTGVGVASSAGIGAANFWHGLHEGTLRFRPISLFPTTTLQHHVGAQIGAWTPGYDQLGPTTVGHGRALRFALSAIDECLADAQLNDIGPDRILIGTTVGDIADREQSWREALEAGVDLGAPLSIDEHLGSTVAAHLGARVPTELLVTACAAGNMALIRSAQLISCGAADVVVCGGAEAISRLAFLGFSRMRGMAKESCRPFTADRDGMLLGEGAAFLVVESAEHAVAREAPVRAVISGYGMSCDAQHPAAPDPTGEGVARAMRSAMADAGPTAVSYVSTHGTGTQQNDAAESAALRQVFDVCPPSSSIKALVGHSLGAASALEAVACVLSIDHQQIIPQWGVTEGATEQGVRLARVEDGTSCEVDLVLNNAFAFGGNNTCVGLRRPPAPITAVAS